jgi:hypothetical protein
VQPRDPTRECNVCVASALSSSNPEPVPRHRTIDAQRRARLDKLVETRRQLDEELAILHWELGQDTEPRERQPTPLPARRWSRCRSSHVRGPKSDSSVVLLPNNLEFVPRRCRPEDVPVTMTDAPTRVRTSTPTPMVMPCYSSGGRHRTSPLQPCCCVAVQR